MTITAPEPAEKLTSKNSHLYVATKAPKGGQFDDDGATSIRFRATDWEHAIILAKTRKLKLEGRYISGHSSEHVAWHVRTRRNIGEVITKLYFFNQLVESGKGESELSRLTDIAQFLRKRNMRPIELCAGDFGSVEEAQRKFNKE